ncbi:hypothetical protein RND81_07G128100 [Saponaria officinalis]|uniref:Uncharacterized protein n=1 Tax=Saponaria officinalis TaxID=3572 RepID=A0AAW1JQG3_SAPOF
MKLTSKSSSLKFYNYTEGVDSNQVYGLFQCRNDISLDVCNACVKDGTREIIHKCHSIGEAVIWYEECMLRYSNRNIFSLSETSPLVDKWRTDDVSDNEEFDELLVSSMNKVIDKASSSMPHFASSETNITLLEQFYSFAQCTPDINNIGCNSCLKKAYSEIRKCCNASIAAMVFMPSCQLRYDIKPFLKVSSSPNSPPVIKGAQGKSKETSTKNTTVTIIAVVAAVGLLGLGIGLWIFLRRRNPEKVSSLTTGSPTSRLPPASPRRMYDGSVKGGDTNGLGDAEFFEYDFATLEIATKEFSSENKLGEGGFGAVYKGTLENGDQIAIKRLSGNSGQGTKEFMTEARLLAKLQHKNLVKLVGFCSEGDEKLLVYEFMPNGSLDGFLFDQRKRHLLLWVTRHKIIVGIARGLQYLHEDSRLTIIHRDLKPGNILLDKQMNPKVADFGLARLFEDAEKFGNTNRIVGTQGYMAPEYLMTGEYSDKSDVYSYGIMLLEIVSGQKNRTFKQTPQKEDLSVHAWRLWNDERSIELTDPVLYNNCPSNDVTRCIQIGLLCVQADARQRPTMTTVVLMLTAGVDLPIPSTPVMSSSQQSNMPMNYGSWQSDIDRSSTKSITGIDLYTAPR